MLAIVPIKQHSERVPDKNFRILGSMPLYCWILRTLLNSSRISGIIIDTDSKNSGLNEFAKNSKIELKQRNKSLLGDFTSMNEIIWDEVKNHPSETQFVMTHVTNPFISTNTIERAMLAYYDGLNSNHDSVFAVSKIFGRVYSSQNLPLNHNPQELSRTQDLDPVFLENSCLYIFDGSSFRRTQSRIGQNPLFFETPPFESLDIDTLEDWRLAEIMVSDLGKNLLLRG